MGMNTKLKEMFQKDNVEQISKFILEVCNKNREDYASTNKKLKNDENYIRTIMLETDFTNYSAYYLIECKRVDGKADLNKKYVNKGIMRFTTQYYSSHYGENIMLGFVVKQVDLTENSQKIEKLQNSSDNEFMHGSFQMLVNDEYQQMYTCAYNREFGTLELRHIFTDISKVIE